MPPMEMSKCLIYINRDEDMKLQYMFKVLTLKVLSISPHQMVGTFFS